MIDNEKKPVHTNNDHISKQFVVIVIMINNEDMDTVPLPSPTCSLVCFIINYDSSEFSPVPRTIFIICRLYE